MNDKSRQKRTHNDLRNQKIRELAASGKSQTEIAQEVGLCRQSVNKVLNSEQTKQLIKEAESQLVGLTGEAISVIRDALKSFRADPQTAVRAAGMVLKSVGLDEKNPELGGGSKPFIVQFLNGEQLQMGFADAEKKETKND